jgi:hypothetical protein
VRSFSFVWLFGRSSLVGRAWYVACPLPALLSLTPHNHHQPTNHHPPSATQAMRDMRAHEVDVLTLGQYLRPTEHHLAVVEYVTPEKFDFFRVKGEVRGWRLPGWFGPWAGEGLGGGASGRSGVGVRVLNLHPIQWVHDNFHAPQ